MVSVPRNVAYEARLRRDLLKYMPDFIAGFRPIPTGFNPQRASLSLAEKRDVVSGEPVLVSTLPRSRFTGLFEDHVYLTVREAETLEKFEAELRVTNFIMPSQLTYQSCVERQKFRVKQRRVAVDGHFETPSLKGAPPAGAEAAFHEVPSPLHAQGGGVKGEERQRPLTLTQRMEMDMMRHILQCKSGPKGGA